MLIPGADPGEVKWVSFHPPPPPLFLSPSSIMLMHRPQTPQPGFGSITLLEKFTPHFKILDPRLNPYIKVDEISAYHDICNDRDVNKHQCDKEMIKRLDKIPYGEMPKWGQTPRFLKNTKQKLDLGLQTKKRKKALSNIDWSQQLAKELRKPITRNFSKRTVISNGIDKIWAADLVKMQKFSKWNTGVKYLLMVIDVFSKYGWIKLLKDKKTETVSKP